MTVVIEAIGLTRRFGRVSALEDVNLTIEKDTITGLLGRNGAGKSVLMSLCTAHDTPTSGLVRVLGENPRENASVLGQTCFMRDNQRYPDEFRLRHVMQAGERFYPGWDSRLADEVVDTFELPGNRDIRKMSRGQLSAVGILVGLASRAPITFFDEPYLGLDATARVFFYDLLLRDYLAHPRTVVLSTHHVDEIENLLTRVIVLDHGRVREDAEVEQLRGRALKLSGRMEAIDRVTSGLEVLHRNSLGTVGTAVVTATQGLSEEAAAAGLRSETASLHELVAAYGLHRKEVVS